MSLNSNKLIPYILIPFITLAGFYSTGNQPDGRLFFAFYFLCGLTIAYPLILFKTCKTKMAGSTLLIHILIFELFGILSLLIRKESLSGMGGIVYFLYPSGILLSLVIGFFTARIIRQINKT